MRPESTSPDPAAVRRRVARENAEYHYAAAARAAEAEARRTAPMVAAFAEAMQSAGVEPSRLRAFPYSGGGTLRTDVLGWYVRRDRRAAVGSDGRWYVLVVAPACADGCPASTSSPATPRSRSERVAGTVTPWLWTSCSNSVSMPDPTSPPDAVQLPVRDA